MNNNKKINSKLTVADVLHSSNEDLALFLVEILRDSIVPVPWIDWYYNINKDDKCCNVETIVGWSIAEEAEIVEKWLNTDALQNPLLKAIAEKRYSFQTK